MGWAISLSTSHHEASGSRGHKEQRPSHRELWDTSLFPSGPFAFDFHGAELFLPLPPHSKLPTESQNRHRSHRQSSRRRHTLTTQHFGGKSKPSCRPGGDGGRAMTCRYLDQSRNLFHLVCCCGCWEQTQRCVTGFLLSDPSSENELSSREAADALS